MSKCILYYLQPIVTCKVVIHKVKKITIELEGVQGFLKRNPLVYDNKVHFRSFVSLEDPYTQ